MKEAAMLITTLDVREEKIEFLDITEVYSQQAAHTKNRQFIANKLHILRTDSL
jgi:hypothetical protein